MPCVMYKMVSLMSYVMYHTKSDITGFACVFVILDSLTKLLPGLFMIVLLPFYVVSMRHQCKIVLTRPITILNTESTSWGRAETNRMHKTILYWLFCRIF